MLGTLISELRFCLHEEKAYLLDYPLKGYQGIKGLPNTAFPVLLIFLIFV